MASHVKLNCKKGCRGCPLCDGGLVICKVCKGAEASLTTDCPGRPLSEEEELSIFNKDLDFKAGKWVEHGVE